MSTDFRYFLPPNIDNIGGVHEGFWEASNPIVWRAFYPALQLATRLLEIALKFPWRNPRVFREDGRNTIASEELTVKLRKTDLFNPRYQEARHVMDQTLRYLATKTVFCLWSGHTKVHSGMPSTKVTFSNTHTIRDSNGEEQYLVTLAYETLELLLMKNQTCEELAVNKFIVASCLVHETMDLVWKMLSRKGFELNLVDEFVFKPETTYLFELRQATASLERFVDLQSVEYWDVYTRVYGIPSALVDFESHRIDWLKKDLVGQQSKVPQKFGILNIYDEIRANPSLRDDLKAPRSHNERRKAPNIIKSKSHSKRDTLQLASAEELVLELPLKLARENVPTCPIFNEIVAYLFSKRSALAINSMNFWIPANTLFCYILREGGLPGFDYETWKSFLQVCKYNNFIFR
ncbi:hypothetical protein HYALB_00003887 [Hymenoscyphus albidus]|uniref:Uncharacterized protein n=1 Tax=Hymenoscyphus albidus TaxID=595503 RepID=A0A9N9LWS5_9HELO|nr:hypothetical protein HYALB_00003887 [Hymenoscyphus albidus]